MTKIPVNRMLVAIGLVGGLAAAPMSSAPASHSSTATEHLDGTLLTLSPRGSYRSATLRVSGPGDYSLTRHFQTGTPIVVDLFTERESFDEFGTVQPRLPDGRYRYEAVLTTDLGESRQLSGLFFVEGGAAIARNAKLSALKDIREQLASEVTRGAESLVQRQVGNEALAVEEYVRIQDVDDNGITTLHLDIEESLGGPRWFLRNYQGDLSVVESPHSATATVQLSIEEGGQVGIGTNAPLQELHIDSPDGGDIRLTGSGADWFVGISGGSNEFIINDQTSAANVLRLAEGAPADSLVVAANGRVGIGTATPAADFDVRGHLRGTTFQSASSRNLKTDFEDVDGVEILDKLIQLPVTSWRYKDDSEETTHIGPVAEDFQRVFALGDGETIANVDAIGVLTAAIQGLRSELNRKDQQIAQLAARLAVVEKGHRPTLGDWRE